MTEQAKGSALVAGAAARAIIPQTFEEVYRLARVFAATEMVPLPFRGKPEDCCVAIMQALELGLSPMAGLQSISVINGRPCLWGDGMVAVVRGSGLLEWMKETDVNEVATCVVKRKGEPEPVTRTFSQADAKRAGLAGKAGPWTQYPQRMRAARARSWALRDTFADVLKGIASAEEMEDVARMKDITPKPARPDALELPPEGNPVAETATPDLPATDTRPSDEVFIEALENAMVAAGTVEALLEVWECNESEISERGLEQAAEDLRDTYMTKARAQQNKPTPQEPQEGSASASLDMPADVPAPEADAVAADLAALDKRLAAAHSETRLNAVFSGVDLKGMPQTVVAKYYGLFAQHKARVRARAG